MVQELLPRLQKMQYSIGSGGKGSGVGGGGGGCTFLTKKSDKKSRQNS